MSTICKVLCCCCYYLCDPSPPSEANNPLLGPDDQSINTPKGRSAPIMVRTSYDSFSSPPRGQRPESRSITPDSAYGDGKTYKGTTTQASPGKSTYGAAHPDDYV